MCRAKKDVYLPSGELLPGRAKPARLGRGKKASPAGLSARVGAVCLSVCAFVFFCGQAKAEGESATGPSASSERRQHTTGRSSDDLKRTFFEAQSAFSEQSFALASERFLDAFALKPVPAFLFNAAFSFEKGEDYGSAIKNYRRYISAVDASVETTALKSRISALSARTRQTPSKKGRDTNGVAVLASAGAPPLPLLQLKGLVVIESEPPSAKIFIGSTAKGQVGVTPFVGSLPPKPVRIVLVAEG